MRRPRGTARKRGQRWYFQAEGTPEPGTGKRKRVQRGGWDTEKEAEDALAVAAAARVLRAAMNDAVTDTSPLS